MLKGGVKDFPVSPYSFIGIVLTSFLDCFFILLSICEETISLKRLIVSLLAWFIASCNLRKYGYMHDCFYSLKKN